MEGPAWLTEWPGPLIFAAIVIVVPIVSLCLDAWDRWRTRRTFRGPHKPLWRRIRARYRTEGVHGLHTTCNVAGAPVGSSPGSFALVLVVTVSAPERRRRRRSCTMVGASCHTISATRSRASLGNCMIGSPDLIFTNSRC
jgi:MYXO-CTERM domain-containing protein